MEWNVTMLLLNSTLLVLAGMLWRKACWMQRFVIVLLITSCALLIVGYSMKFLGVREFELFDEPFKWWHVITLGFIVEHLAVVMHIFRVTLQGGQQGGITRRI